MAHIWIDADACPRVIKDILFRAANRKKINLILVSNQSLVIPTSVFIKHIKVSSGFDMADNYIVQHLAPGDLVITADIPLADAVVHKNGIALNPRGMLYTSENIKQYLSIRNFSEGLRGSGLLTGGPASLSKKEIQAFSNHLDRFLARHTSR